MSEHFRTLFAATPCSERTNMNTPYGVFICALFGGRTYSVSEEAGAVPDPHFIDLTRPPLPETAEQAYRRGFTDAVLQLAYGGSPMSWKTAVAWWQLCREWKASYRKDPAFRIPPRPEDAKRTVRRRG